ncbi:MAG: Xanthine phosphoribosyltransferase [Anaerolineae bacterium]|nr:Xanthine phosphoribosyltransferase [Anaerolineae bacterium]
MENVDKIYLTWHDVDRLIGELIPRLMTYNYDLVLAITRGGIVPAAIIAERLGIAQVLVASVDFYEDEEHDLDWPVFMQFPADSSLRGKTVLIVDDIWDRGKQAVNVTERVKQAGGRPYSVVIHYKSQRSRFPDQSPDFFAVETNDWIIYPWEVERGAVGT